MDLRQVSHVTTTGKADLRIPQRAEKKRKRPTATALCAPSPTGKKAESSLEDGEVEESKAKKPKLGDPDILQETDKNKILSDQLKQLPRIRKYPPGTDRRSICSAGRRDRGIKSGDHSLKRRTASDRPAGIDKHKRYEDVTNGLKTAKLNNKRIEARGSPKPEATARLRVRSTRDKTYRRSEKESPKRKTVGIYHGSSPAVERKQPPAGVKSSANTASVSASDIITSKTEADFPQKALTQVGEVSLPDDCVTKSPSKVPRKVEPEVDRELTKDILDEEVHRKGSQEEILSKKKLENGQIPSESVSVKASTPTPSQKKIPSDSQREKRPTRDDPSTVEDPTKNIDESLTSAMRSTAGQVSSHKEVPTVARIGYPGLINDRFSCYQNTAFQILANTTRFADHIKRTRWADKKAPAGVDLNLVSKRGTARGTRIARLEARKTSGLSKSVASRLSRLFRSMHSQLDSRYVIDSGVVTEAISSRPGKEHFSGEKQQDAGEFLGSLIQMVWDEEKLLQIGSEATEVHKLFGGKQEQRIICSGCRHVSAQNQDLLGLTLDVPEDEKLATVEAMLKNYSSTEELPEDHKCEKCHEAGKTRKAYQITETPQYLVVTLDRGKSYYNKYDIIKTEKKRTRVPIPKGVIDLSNCFSLKEPVDKILYAVRGVGVHKGKSPSTGHYFAVCKGADSKWREFNDEVVREPTATDFVSYERDTQILLLERQD
ncbi:MAG: hypothetical protein Q9195_005145 [Heterodermia aff. obscurata]